jgi:hypothetical protein
MSFAIFCSEVSVRIDQRAWTIACLDRTERSALIIAFLNTARCVHYVA